MARNTEEDRVAAEVYRATMAKGVRSCKVEAQEDTEDCFVVSFISNDEWFFQQDFPGWYITNLVIFEWINKSILPLKFFDTFRAER